MKIAQFTFAVAIAFQLGAVQISHGSTGSTASSDQSLSGKFLLPEMRLAGNALESRNRFIEPAGDITLLDAFAAALLNNPQLAQYSWSERAKEAQVLQAGLLPNPEFEVELEEFGGSGSRSGVDEAESTILVSQLIELGQKRQKRVKAAQLGQEIALLDYEAARVALLKEVSRAFVAVMAAQRHHEITMLNFDLAEQALRFAEKRLEAGVASSLERSKALSIATSEKINLQRSQREWNSSRIALAALWAAKSPRFDTVSGHYLTHDRLPPIRLLYERISEHPEIARWSAEIARRDEMIRLERAQATPDLKLGAGIKHFNGTDDLSAVIQFSIPIPLFDRNQGNVLRAKHERQIAYQAQREAEVRIQSMVTDFHQQLVMTHGELSMIKDELLITAERVYDDSRIAYQEGKVDYLEVIDAQRMLFDARLRYNDSQATYHRIALEIEAAIGISLSSLMDTGDQASHSEQYNKERLN